MRFGFWFDYDQTYTFVELYKVLARQFPGSAASGILVNDRYLAHAKDGLPAGTRIVQLYELITVGRNYQPSASELADFAKFDERHRLARIAYSDRHLNLLSYDELRPLYIYLISRFRDYVRDERPDIFVFPCIASQFPHLLYLVLRDMGVRTFIPIMMGVEDLVYLCDNPYFLSEKTWRLFDEMKQGRDAPRPDEVQWAERFMANIRHGGVPYKNAAVPLEARKMALPNPLRLAYCLKYLRNYLLHDRKDPTLLNPVQRLAAIFRRRAHYRRSLKFFCGEDAIGEDFVLFPLHYEPEIATLIISQYEQTSVVDIIARQLPISCRLVLKEHPAMVGQRDWRFYQRLCDKYPNVVFVDPNVSVNHLARRARAVFSLSGTPILEALILGRPVIYTSRARFGGFGLGTFTENLIDFGAALDRAKRDVPDQADLVCMLVAIHRTSHRLKIAEPLGDMSVLAPDNIESFALAILLEAKAA